MATNSQKTTSLQVKEHNSTYEEACQDHLESDLTSRPKSHSHQHYGDTVQSRLWEATGRTKDGLTNKFQKKKKKKGTEEELTN